MSGTRNEITIKVNENVDVTVDTYMDISGSTEIRIRNLFDSMKDIEIFPVEATMSDMRLIIRLGDKDFEVQSGFCHPTVEEVLYDCADYYRTKVDPFFRIPAWLHGAKRIADSSKRQIRNPFTGGV